MITVLTWSWHGYGQLGQSAKCHVFLLPHASWHTAISLSPRLSSKVLQATCHVLQEQTSSKIALDKLQLVRESPYPHCLVCVHMDEVKAGI